MPTLINHDNLENYADAEAYDAEDDSDTGVAFYTGLARETGGPVLEIACGTGRVAIPIARAGFAVTGVDIVPGMLDVARRKSAGLPARWVEGDARAFDLDERFSLVFVTGNAFQAFLTREDQEALLGRVQAHMDDDGLFAFETRNPRWPRRDLPGDGSRSTGQGLFSFLESLEGESQPEVRTDVGGREVRLSRSQSYDHVAQILHWTTHRRWVEDGREQEKVSRIAVRFTFPRELEVLLHYNGFAIERQFGDWDLQPLAAESPSIISVCRKRT